jgi:drug/metabolite transporter (DMT)-like permease
MEAANTQVKPSHAKGLAIGFIGVMVLSPDALLIRLVTVDGWTLVFWRGLLMGSVLLIGVAVTNRGAFVQTLRRIGKTGVVTSMVQAAGSICFVMSILHTQVANTLIILGTLPMFVAVFSSLFLKEQPRMRTLLAIPLSALGIWITVHEGVALGQWTGDLLALCTACLGSFHLILLRFAKNRNMIPSAALGGFFIASSAFIFAPTISVSSNDIAYIAILGCFVIPIAFACFVTAPRYIPAPEICLVVLLEMVFGPYWVWLGIGEQPADSALLGGGIVLVTLLVHSILSLRDTPLGGRRVKASVS